jgi:parvulin-like peptidyl-prolyl isomerase
VFLSTLNRPREEALVTMQKALAELRGGRVDFTALASRLSEDPASKSRGGDLGWMTRARLPGDFADPVFSLPLDQSALVTTRIGLHIVEVTARQAARPRGFDEAMPEVLAALRTRRRDQAASEFRDSLRRFEAEKIEVFHDMLAD